MSRRFVIAAAAVALALALCLSSSPVSVSAFELTMESPEVRNSAYFRFAAVDADALAHLSFPTETSLLALRSHARGEPIAPAPAAALALAGNATAANATAPQGGFDLGVAKLDKTYTRAEARELWRQHQATFKRGRPYSPKEEEERFLIFEKNLQSVGEQNFKHGSVAQAAAGHDDGERGGALRAREALVPFRSALGHGSSGHVVT